MKKLDSEILAEYITTIMAWLCDYTHRGQKNKRRKIKKLGDELVKRGLLTQEKQTYFTKAIGKGEIK